MADSSLLDRKYFLDDDKFNCPYCNRRSVVYSVHDFFSFDWSGSEPRYGYIIKCHGCDKKSLHLSTFLWTNSSYRFASEPLNWIEEKDYDIDNLDYLFFYHHPTSFFTLNQDIPRVIRDFISEANG